MRAGDLVADFELDDQSGTRRRFGELLADGPVVLFFYPAALTTGCTAESCHFRDLSAEFAAVGARPVGISPDPVAKQGEFARRHGLGLPLLSDPDRRVAAQFGVRRRFGPLPVRRRTFVVDTDRRVLGVVGGELRMAAHADSALEVLRRQRN